MGKFKPSQELNCGSCGYNTCREKAAAICQGKAEISMCLPFLKDKAESFSDTIVNSSPNGLIVLNENLEVQQINKAAREIMNIRYASDVLGDYVIRILDPTVFENVLKTGRGVSNQRVYLAEYKRYVEQTVVKYTSIIAEDDTKTDESEASLPLFDDARELLLEVKAQQEEYRKLFGKEYIENDYIFKHPDGTLYRPDSLTRSFQRVLKRKGLEIIRFHDLRHATASILYSQNWKPLELAHLMRHSNMRTTLQIYTHPSDEYMEESCKSLNGLFYKSSK